MSRFVMRNHPKPLVKIQAPEEGMRPTVRAQLALAVFLEQPQRALAQLPEAREHRFLLSNQLWVERKDRKSTRLNSSHLGISYAVFCLKKKTDISYTDRI